MIESFFNKMTKQMLKGIKTDEISVAEAVEAGVKTNDVCTS